MTKTYYIAGPMRGYDCFNFPAFDACAAELREWGYRAISPAEHDRAAGFDETLNSLEGFDMGEALLWDLKTIALDVDGVVLLPGWEKSSGVAAEMATARALGKEVYEYEADQSKRDTQAGRYMLNLVPADRKPSTEHEIGSTDWRGATDPIEQRRMAAKTQTTWLEYLAETVSAEIRITDPETGGQKGQKLARFDLIPAGALWQLAEHYGRGAEKYADDNWRRGYSWRLSFGALMRHAWAFWNGEDIDPETGSPHMVAVAWHAFTLLTFAAEDLGTDDRQSRGFEVSE